MNKDSSISIHIINLSKYKNEISDQINLKDKHIFSYYHNSSKPYTYIYYICNRIIQELLTVYLNVPV